MSRELDVQVLEKVFGKKMLGRCMAVSPDGSWALFPSQKEEQSEDWACSAGFEPVYVRDECNCKEIEENLDTEENEEMKKLRKELYKDNTFMGHHTMCLDVCKHYSLDPSDTKLVILEMDKKGYSFMVHGPKSLVNDEFSSYAEKWTATFSLKEFANENNTSDMTLDSRPWHLVADGETMEEAICNSAIKIAEKKQ